MATISRAPLLHTYYAVVSRNGQLRPDGIGQSPMIALNQFTWASRLTWEQAVEFGYRMHKITVEISHQLNVIVDTQGNVIICDTI